MAGGPVRVHLVRHGEVDNPERVLYGRLPGYHLSDLGRAQALATAQFLAGRDIGYLVASPLDRAQETASPLADLLSTGVETDERLIEADNIFEGRQVAGGQNLRELLTNVHNWKYFRNPVRPSWGEPYAQIANRVLAAAAAARDRVVGTGQEAVCVSHQLPVVSARRSAEGLRLYHDPRKRECSLGSVTTLTFDGDVIVRVQYVEPAADLPPGHGAGA